MFKKPNNNNLIFSCKNCNPNTCPALQKPYIEISPVFFCGDSTVFLTSAHALNFETCRAFGIKKILCCAREIFVNYNEFIDIKHISIRDNILEDFLLTYNEMADYIAAGLNIDSSYADFSSESVVFSSSKESKKRTEKNCKKHEKHEKHDNCECEHCEHCEHCEQNNIAVVCHAGVSRSVSAILAFLAKYKNVNPEKALAELRKSRPCVNPYSNFVIFLNNYWNRALLITRFSPSKETIETVETETVETAEKTEKTEISNSPPFQNYIISIKQIKCFEYDNGENDDEKATRPFLLTKSTPDRISYKYIYDNFKKNFTAELCL